MKKNIWKRIASFALAFVMVVGMLPMTTLTANAASNSATSGLYTLTITEYYSFNNSTGNRSDSTISDVEITDISLNSEGNIVCKFRVGKLQSNGNVTYEVEHTVTAPNSSCVVPFSAPISSIKESNYFTNYTIGTLTRQAQASHTGGQSNCTTGAVCTVCGTTYGSPNNTHNWGEWTTTDTAHSRTCKLNANHTETDNHTAEGGTEATCTEKAVCGTCNNPYGPEPAGHSLKHRTGDGSYVEEYCTKCTEHTAKATLTLSAEEFTYTGTAITPASLTYDTDWLGEKNLESNIGYHNNVNVGTAVAQFGKNGLSFKINPASLDNATIALEYVSNYYDGTPKRPRYTVTLDGFGELVKGRDYEAVYLEAMKMDNGVPTKWFGNHTSTTDAACIDAGTYGIIIRGVDGGNFAVSEGNEMGVFAAFTITKAQPTAEMFYVDLPQGMVYDGTIHAADVSVKDDIVGMGEVTVKYNGGAAPTDAGTFIVTVDVAEGDNYCAISDLELGRFTVDRINGTGTILASDWTYGESAVSPHPVSSTNGTEHVTYLYKAVDADDSTFTTTIPTQAGDYTVKAVFAATTNYNAVEYRADFTIHKAVPDIGTVTAGVVEDTLETSAIVLTRENTTVEGILTVDAEQTLAWGDNSIRYTFTPNDTTNYKVVTGEVAVTVVDTIAPTGTVTISTKSWAEFLNNITFNLFFKETQTVSVTHSDNLSGVDKVEYIESKVPMDRAAVEAAEQWTEMENGSVSVTREDTKQFVYYIRLTDKAGNVTYLSTDGAEYDTTAPVIEGVADGETYYTTKTVTVTDTNLETVTLNGESVTGEITLEGNKEATYTIAATDKAGNETTVAVTMKPIRALAEATEDLSHDNVTSDNAPALEELVEKLEELLADENVSDDGERETLEQHKHIAESLLKTIEDAAKAVDTENTAKVEDVTAENVTSEDKGDLENAKADLEKALEDKSSNYTEEEKKAIQAELDRIDGALEVIENAEAVEKMISELPETAKPEDEEAVEKIDAAKKAYEELTDHGKKLVDEKTKEKLDKLTAAVVDYKIVEGNGSKWTEGSTSGLSFTANGSFSKFVGIAVNGKEVAMENYEAKAGSTVITLKPSYLNTLKPGEYEFAVVYTDGAAECSFTVEAKPEETKPEASSPATGDDAHIMLYGAMFTVSLAALIVLLLDSKKRRQENA